VRRSEFLSTWVLDYCRLDRMPTRCQAAKQQRIPSSQPDRRRSGGRHVFSTSLRLFAINENKRAVRSLR